MCVSNCPHVRVISPTLPPAVSLREAFWFWLLLGLISFGGPARQIAIMHQELVEKRMAVRAGVFCMR